MPIDYVVKRVLQLLLIVFIAVTVNFGIPRLIPGDPIESALQTKLAMTGNANVDIQAVAAAYRAKFGLDKPMWQQYLNYWASIFTRDLGVSLVDFPQQAFSTLPPGALNQNRRERVANVSKSALREHFVALEAEDVQALPGTDRQPGARFRYHCDPAALACASIHRRVQEGTRCLPGEACHPHD